MKIGKFEHSVPVSGVTKKEFFRILDKASQPIKHEAESGSKKSQTQVVHLCDGYNGMSIH